jgi:hypothetical protein
MEKWTQQIQKEMEGIIEDSDKSLKLIVGIKQRKGSHEEPEPQPFGRRWSYPYAICNGFRSQIFALPPGVIAVKPRSSQQVVTALFRPIPNAR